MNQFPALIVKLGPLICSLVVAFALVLAGAIVVQSLRFRSGRRRLDALRQVGLDWEPETHAELRGYLHPSTERVDLAGDRRFLLRVSRREMLQGLSAGSKPLRLGPLFTGVALFCTFVLIGLVLLEQVQAALNDVAASETALAQASRSLAEAVGGLGAKFFISAAGIVCTVVYTVFELCIEAAHERQLDAVERDLRGIFASPEEYDGLLQREHLKRLADVCAGVGRLQSIEVSVQNLSSEVVDQLSKVITKDMGEQVQGMIEQALARVDEIAERTQQAFSGELKVAVASAQQAIPAVIQQLEEIRKAIAQQAESPVVALLEQFKGAMRTGYQQETSQLAAALRQLSSTIPEMARTLEAAGQRVTERLSADQARGQQVQDQLFTDIKRLLEHLEQQQTALESSVGRIHGETLQAAVGVSSQLKEQLETAAAGFIRVAATQTDAMNDRVGVLLSTQQSSFTELEKTLGSVVARLGDAERALAGSAQNLESSARQLNAAQASNDQLVVGARNVVAEVRSSAQALNESAGSAQALLEHGRRIVHSAMEHADREVQLTSQLQTVWPKLFDTYLQSFQQKSDALASSWETTHHKVANVVTGIVDQLQDPVDELRDTVNDLAKSLKAGGTR